MSLTFPASAADITTEWLNEALAPVMGGGKVLASEALASATPGQTAEIVEVALQYDGAGDTPGLPSRLIAKITSANPQVIELVTQFDQYRREVAFYNDFPDVGIATPRCLLARHEPAGQKMVLLLEHLAPSVSHSWALSPQQVAEAADHLPAFHARWWQNEDVRKKDWLVQTTDMDFWTAGAYGANSAAPVLREHFGTTADTTIEVMAFFLENINKVMASIARRPITLVHGDYHGKQMFFPSSEGGGFAVIDWQFPFAAQGAWDLARIMALGLDSEVRRENQDQLASDYYSGLVRCGVLDYTPDDLDYDLAMGTIASQMIMAIAIVGTDPALIQAECEHLGVDWKEVFILRGDRMLQDVGALDFLKAISNG